MELLQSFFGLCKVCSLLQDALKKFLTFEILTDFLQTKKNFCLAQLSHNTNSKVSYCFKFNTNSKMKKLIVLLGTTASGKTEISLKLVERFKEMGFGSEIVSSDSVQIYKKLNIGSAKPSPRILKKTPHHLVDIIEPDQKYSAGRFVLDATQAINSIQKKIPILIGGNWLYVHSLIYGMAQLPSINEKIKLQAKCIFEKGQAYQLLQEKDPLAAKKLHPKDGQRILRALEVFLSSGKSIFTFHKRQKKKEYCQPLFLGIKISKEELNRKINQRVLDMFRSGWIEEVESLLKNYPASIPGFNSIGYKQVVDFLQSKSTKKNEMIKKIQQKSCQYAKRQRTWYRRIENVYWRTTDEFSDSKNLDFITNFLKN